MNDAKPPVFDLTLSTAAETRPARREADARLGDEPVPPPYARAQAAWEDRHGVLRAERERWFRIAMMLAVLVALTTALAVWAAARAEYQPVIVAVDDLGQAVPVITPRTVSDWPPAAVRRELAEFIRDWRSVSIDRDVMRNRLRRIQYFMDENSTADRKIVAWGRDPATSPFKRAETSTVDVTVHNVNSLGGNSWLAEWTETTRNRVSGRVTETVNYKATLSLGRRNKVSDREMLIRNPFAMAVMDVDVVRLSE